MGICVVAFSLLLLSFRPNLLHNGVLVLHCREGLGGLRDITHDPCLVGWSTEAEVLWNEYFYFFLLFVVFII